jgi:hypothetical protein
MIRPAFQFYPGDWLHDTSLRACSLAARGLWIDIISHMHQGKPYGHLTLPRVEGETAKTTPRPILPAVLARMVGSSEHEVTKLLAELNSAGVFSWSGRGTIFSRRMVKDEKLRKIRKAGGFESLRHPNVPKPRSKTRIPSRRSSVMSFPGSPSSSPSKISGAVPAQALATEILEELELPLLPPNTRAVIASIESVSRKDGTTLMEAATWIRSRALQVKTDGQQISVFWFQDAKYNLVIPNSPTTVERKVHDPDANCPKCRGTGWFPAKAHPGREIRCYCVEERAETA